MIVAVDGPAGAGKSSVARALAVRLGVPYIDTGAMYRAVGLMALRAGFGSRVDADDAMALEQLVRAHRLQLKPEDGGMRVLVDEEDVSGAIRSPEASAMASVVSAVSGVRRALVPIQRSMARERGGVLEGRDIGTVVFPDATLKVYLTADPEERALRRWRELAERGVEVDLADVLEEQKSRDTRDSSRCDSPLKVAEGAVVIDSTDRSIDEVVDAILAELDRVRPNRLTDGGVRS